MAQDDRLRHASSFGGAAAAYAEHRPDYAGSAVQWALAPAPGRRVLDLGAGTGKLTAMLDALGAPTWSRWNPTRRCWPSCDDRCRPSAR